MGPYYKNGYKPVKLLATTEYVRAVPGGTGSFKLGANYAPCLVPQGEANKDGYDQNLWLLGPEHYLTEVSIVDYFPNFARLTRIASKFVGRDYELIRRFEEGGWMYAAYVLLD